MARKKTKRRGGTCGYAMCFHGSFTDETKAKNKARKVGGFYKRKYIVGQSKKRFVVMTRSSDAPF
jgi:hypothetical protein